MFTARTWINIGLVVICSVAYKLSSDDVISKFQHILYQASLYALVAGVVVLLYTIFHYPTRGKRKMRFPSRSEILSEETAERVNEIKFVPIKSIKHKNLISRNVDEIIEQLISLLLRDYVDSWYKRVMKKDSTFCNSLKSLVRQMLFTFRDRCQKIDHVKFITSDIVIILTEHLQTLKCATVNEEILENPENMRPFKVYSHLQSKEAELDYLRQISDFVLITLLPIEYANSLGVRHLLREILAHFVFYNAVDKICDPDIINMRLISYLKSQEELLQNHGRTYSVAETYEDFIKMIQISGSIENLNQWRYYIVSEIMHATTASQLKRSKGMDADKEFNTVRRNKGDLLEARNLSRYLNQLRFAKNLCERRIKLLGGADHHSSLGLPAPTLDKKLPIPGQNVLSMNVIIQSKICRHHFSKFLQKEDMHSLISFWEAVEEMKMAEKHMWHQIGNDIVQMYIYNQKSAVRLSKNTLKGIEEFMMADKGPESFYCAQEEVSRLLEERFYSSFIVSDIYHKMVTEAAKSGTDFIQLMKDEMNDDTESMASRSQSNLDRSIDADISLFDHTSYARAQLKILQEKLNEKILAFSALKNNPKFDRKVISKVDREIQDLCCEQNMIQNHIEKTELWIKYLGLWQATVVQVEVLKENDKDMPYCNVMVHLSNDSGHPDLNSAGWVVSKSLTSFQSLHRKLVPAASWLKKVDLPSKPRFRSLDHSFLEKSKTLLQIFLSAVTKDDSLNKSEALYNFLSPSPEHMKHPPTPQKKALKFSLSNIFKNSQNNNAAEMEEPDEIELLFLDETDREDEKDSIAGAIYILIGEIFEIKGVFSWLRRSLIIFVQTTYGRTINRQLRETVSGMLSEPMLLTYLQTFHDTMWPKNPRPRLQRSPEEKIQTRQIARNMTLNNIPEVVFNLLGQQNTIKGITKLFDALQEKSLNKQLIYNILEAFLYEYSPELQKISKKHRNSL